MQDYPQVGGMLGKRIGILIIAMFAIVFGITMWITFRRGRLTETYDAEVIYVGAALVVYAIYHLAKRVWERVRGISHLSLMTLGTTDRPGPAR